MDLPVLENSMPVNNPVFISLSWDNFQVHCRTLLNTQPKHVLCQFFQYIYHSKTHAGICPKKIECYVNTVMPHGSCTSSLAQKVETKCHLYTEVSFYKGIMWIIRNSLRKIQQDATMYQNFIIPYLNEAQHVLGDTPPIIKSLKLHWQPLVFHTWKVVGRVIGGRCQAHCANS